MRGAYKDEGISGTTLKRKGFQRLLADAQAGEFDVVVCTYMSRLGRGDTFTVAEYLLKEAGVKVEMVKEQFTDDMSGYVNKTDDAVRGRDVRRAGAPVDQDQDGGDGQGGLRLRRTSRLRLRERSSPDAAMVIRKATRSRPSGSCRIPKRRALVLRAYESVRRDAQPRERADLPESDAATQWSFDNLTYLLRNEAYRGVLVFGDWRNENAMRPSSRRTVGERYAPPMRAASRRRKQNPKDVYPYYLRGVVYCPHCGCKMTPAAHPGRTATVPYYECIYSFKKRTVGALSAASMPRRCTTPFTARSVVPPNIRPG